MEFFLIGYALSHYRIVFVKNLVIQFFAIRANIQTEYTIGFIHELLCEKHCLMHLQDPDKASEG